jgi:hypothetical protein
MDPAVLCVHQSDIPAEVKYTPTLIVESTFPTVTPVSAAVIVEHV